MNSILIWHTYISTQAKQLCIHNNLELKFITQLTTIQNTLFDIGFHVATPKASKQHNSFHPQYTHTLEVWIDEMENSLKALESFILPDGGNASSYLHICRAVCRRAERTLVPLLENEELESEIFAFMNRLGDYLFVLARTVCQKQGMAETKWEKESMRK